MDAILHHILTMSPSHVLNLPSYRLTNYADKIYNEYKKLRIPDGYMKFVNDEYALAIARVGSRLYEEILHRAHVNNYEGFWLNDARFALPRLSSYYRLLHKYSSCFQLYQFYLDVAPGLVGHELLTSCAAAYLDTECVDKCEELYNLAMVKRRGEPTDQLLNLRLRLDGRDF